MRRRPTTIGTTCRNKKLFEKPLSIVCVCVCGAWLRPWKLIHERVRGRTQKENIVYFSVCRNLMRYGKRNRISMATIPVSLDIPSIDSTHLCSIDVYPWHSPLSPLPRCKFVKFHWKIVCLCVQMRFIIFIMCLPVALIPAVNSIPLISFSFDSSDILLPWRRLSIFIDWHFKLQVQIGSDMAILELNCSRIFIV